MQIIEKAAWNANEEKGIITSQNVADAAFDLGTEMTRFLPVNAFDLLKQLKENLEKGKITVYEDILQTLLEQGVVLEYNNFTYKRVNPLVELSAIYQQKVS